MKIQDILKHYSVMMDCVPLSITEPGFAYLNPCDTGIWLITFNYKHSEVHREYVTIRQLLYVFQTQNSYYEGMKEKFQKELPEIIALLKQQDPATKIEF